MVMFVEDDIDDIDVFSAEIAALSGARTVTLVAFARELAIDG